MTGISLQTNKKNIYHVIITINVWKSVFTYVSYQPAPRLKWPRHKYQVCQCLFFFTSVCQNLLVNVLPMPDYWSKKNWKKLVLKCHKDHFSQQSTYLMYCGVDELSITYCSILVICMPLTLHAECPIFAFRCRLILLKSFYQLPPSVQILLTLPAVFEGLLINYCDTSCHML